MIGRAAAFGLALASLAACDRRTRGVDVELVPNSAFTNEADLAAHVATLEYRVDAMTGGLYPPGREATRGPASIEDADGDPSDLELVVRVPFDEAFPTIRILEGSLPEVPLSIRVRGLTDEGVPYAEGSVRDVIVRRGVPTVRVTFDVFPQLQPPRVGVARLLEEDACVTPTVLLVFSRAVAPSTVLARDAIRFAPGGPPRAIVLEASGVTALVEAPLEVLDGPSFALEVGLGIETTDGVTFDQLPTTPEPDAFEGTFPRACP